MRVSLSPHSFRLIPIAEVQNRKAGGLRRLMADGSLSTTRNIGCFGMKRSAGGKTEKLRLDNGRKSAKVSPKSATVSQLVSLLQMQRQMQRQMQMHLKRIKLPPYPPRGNQPVWNFLNGYHFIPGKATSKCERRSNVHSVLTVND